MSETVISVQNLTKRYMLRHETASGAGLRHALQDTLTAPLRWLRSGKGPHRSAATSKEEFWALNDVSFEVKRGAVIGIIGRNGAGKSTLLKILSRITEPTSGRVEIEGRVASLLEVGTGFHPELTGRENVFLNGAILGMTRAEIRRKFDEIVAFAEIERFLDTPVKRYSSGMYVRLAFAVAAHLEPEILIVDEVLAVGDASFQKKCLGKMSEVSARNGRTVFFVSHNMAAVQQLCTECILMDQGRATARGTAAEITRLYAEQGARAKQSLIRNGEIEMETMVKSTHGGQMRAWNYQERLRLETRVTSERELSRPAIDLAFYSEGGQRLISLRSDRLGDGPARFRGTATYVCEIENPGFTVGEITLDVGLREGVAGPYLLLQSEVARFGVNYASLPEGASHGAILHPQISQRWEPNQ